MGNKESPWETKLGETKGEGVGMGNKGGGHGKQRKGNKGAASGRLNLSYITCLEGSGKLNL